MTSKKNRVHMDDMLIELPKIWSSSAKAPLAEVWVSSSAITEHLTCWADDEPSIFTESRCRRPGWLWIGYMAFGIAFWAGLGFAIRALLVAI
jgi:hypothetical protein